VPSVEKPPGGSIVGTEHEAPSEAAMPKSRSEKAAEAKAAAIRKIQGQQEAFAQKPEQSLTVVPPDAVCLFCHAAPPETPSYFSRRDGRPCFQGESIGDRHWYCSKCITDQIYATGPTCVVRCCGSFEQFYVGGNPVTVREKWHGTSFFFAC
jgi:hypothetical protein